jgi:hypothetical protein
MEANDFDAIYQDMENTNHIKDILVGLNYEKTLI